MWVAMQGLFGYADVELCEDNRCATLELIYRTSFMPRASI